jgi:hypothetical protein
MYNAQTINTWQDNIYRLPFEPDATYLPVVNDRGYYESHGIHYKVTIDHITQTVGDVEVTYPVLKLNHYVNGTLTPWEADQNVSFKVDYIVDENDL